jgi:hypothetical protein
MSITAVLFMLFLPAGWLHGPVSFAEEFNEFVERDVHLLGLGQEGIAPLGENPQAFAACERGSDVLRDKRAGGAPLGDKAGDFEFPISAGDGVRIDKELFGEAADGRQLLARPQPVRGDEVFHLVDDLEVDGNAVSG